MITLLQTGNYKLVETKTQTKILILDEKQTFAWINAAGIGEILVISDKIHHPDTTLAVGEFHLYEIKDEPNLTDLQHLELNVGNHIWQGYLLPTGLPTETDRRNRIIPTSELVTRR